MPSGGSTTQELIFSLSANYSGLYYILAILDPNNISYQYNSTNLFGSIPLNVGQSDLSIKFRSITPASTYAGEQIEINSTLANASAISTGSKSVVQYYLSKNSILDSSDLGIGSFSVSAILPNETLVAPKLSYTIPPATPAGKYYIMIFADKTRAIPESNENNNVDSILFTVNPAPITDLSIKFTKATPTSVMPGDVVLLDCLIINSGSTSIGRSSLGYHISYNNIIFDALDPAITFPVGIPIVEPGIVIEAAQISYKVPNNAAAGTYTIFFVADSDKEYLESNEENNIGSASFNVGSLPELLAVPPVLSNSNLLPGQSTKINFTVKNNGAGDAGSFQIKYFFSSNDIYESTDLEILTSQNVAAVTGGKSFVANEVSFTIPTSTTAGTYYIFAMADFGATVKESNEADNMSSATFKVGAFADMKANPLILDKTKVLPLETISISGSLSNAGGSTAINFDVQYYISTESIFNAATATPLFSAVLVPPLSAEELYTLPIQKYIIPSGSKEGIYYLFAILDKSATIAESNESNNVAVASFTIASLADLKVITPFASATALLPGESSEISFEVFNNGTSASLSCTLSFFLSTSPEYKTGDTPVLAPVVIPDLMPGESFAITPQSYKMPTPASAGAYYIVAVVDIKNEVIESIESNK